MCVWSGGDHVALNHNPDVFLKAQNSWKIITANKDLKNPRSEKAWGMPRNGHLVDWAFQQKVYRQKDAVQMQNWQNEIIFVPNSFLQPNRVKFGTIGPPHSLKIVFAIPRVRYAVFAPSGGAAILQTREESARTSLTRRTNVRDLRRFLLIYSTCRTSLRKWVIRCSSVGGGGVLCLVLLFGGKERVEVWLQSVKGTSSRTVSLQVLWSTFFIFIYCVFIIFHLQYCFRNC